MTCIVGIADGETVWIGGDSCGVGSGHIVTRSDPKVFRSGPFIMGYSTSFRMGQVLQHALRVPPHDDALDDHAFMVTTFIDAVRTCFRSAGFLESKDGRDMGGSFLVGYRGWLYNIDSDYQVGISAEQVDAIGNGFHFALGSLFETAALCPRDRIARALLAAEHLSPEVRGPFTVLSLSRGGQAELSMAAE